MILETLKYDELINLIGDETQSLRTFKYKPLLKSISKNNSHECRIYVSEIFKYELPGHVCDSIQ